MKETIYRTYMLLYHFVAKKRIRLADTSSNKIHALNLVVLATSILMWTYTWVSYTYSHSITPFYIGVVTSSVHLLSPLFLRLTSNMFLISSIMLGSGVIHQASFAFYSGGFTSSCLIWLGIIPMLAGITIGKRGVLLWGLVTIIITFTFFLLNLNNYEVIDYLTYEGHLFNQGLITLGYIFLSTSLIYAYLILESSNKALMKESSAKIRNLLRIVLHDISTPLMIVNEQLKRLNYRVVEIIDEDKAKPLTKMIKKTSIASTTIKDIITNLRNMQSIQDGKQEINRKLVSLNECIDHTLFIYSSQIQQKNLTINYDTNNLEDIKVFVDEVIFKNQILSNVISNAVKFSEENSSIDILVKENEDNIILTVKDYGLGMPGSIRKNLFTEGRSTSRKGTKGESGTGYGMIIIKSSIEALGGSLEVRSRDKENSLEPGTEILIKLSTTES